jgi:hypothetical protein
MSLYAFFVIAAAIGLTLALTFASSRRRVLLVEAIGLAIAIAFTVYGVIHSHDPDCRECGGGFFAGLISAYGFVAWSFGTAVGAGIRRLISLRPRN